MVKVWARLLLRFSPLSLEGLSGLVPWTIHPIRQQLPIVKARGASAMPQHVLPAHPPRDGGRARRVR